MIVGAYWLLYIIDVPTARYYIGRYTVDARICSWNSIVQVSDALLFTRIMVQCTFWQVSYV